MNPSVKMFKKLAAFVCCAVFMCSFTSCSLEDNPVTHTGSASITLNTQALYEEIDYSESALNNLASGYFFIENTLLVYDETGKLVGKYVENANDLQPVSFNVCDLPNGNYTVVAVEHGRQQDTPYWELTDEENLSTVQIRRTNEHTYWTFALGLASQLISVLNGEVKATLTPKAAGSLFEVRVKRTQSFKNHLRVWGNHMPTGLYLNPQLDEDERLAYNENDTWGTICLIDPSLQKSAFFTIGRGEQKIEVSEYNATDRTWSALWWGKKANLTKEPHAMFCYDSTPQLLYKAFIGSTDQYPAWVEGHAKGLLLEPIMDYGKNVEDFDKIVTSSIWYCGPQNSNLTQWGTSWVKSYAVWPNGKLQLACYFETEDGKNATQFIYQYEGDDITADQMREEILSWGYEYKGYFYATDNSNMKSFVYLKPNGVDEIQFWQPVNGSSWFVAFHQYDQEDFDLLIPE